MNNVKEFLQDIDPSLEYNVLSIYDMYGPTIHDSTFEVIYCKIKIIFTLLIKLNKIKYFR